MRYGQAQQALAAIKTWAETKQGRLTPETANTRSSRLDALVNAQMQPIYSGKGQKRKLVNGPQMDAIRKRMVLKEGCLPPVIASGAKMYPHVPSAFRAQDDPPEASFAYLTVERVLMRSKSSRALLNWVYVHGNTISSYPGKNPAANRKAHQRIIESVRYALWGSEHDQKERTISEKFAEEILKAS